MPDLRCCQPSKLRLESGLVSLELCDPRILEILHEIEVDHKEEGDEMPTDLSSALGSQSLACLGEVHIALLQH